MGIGGDGLRYLGEMQVHRRGVAEGQDETRGLAFGRTDRAEDVGRSRALVLGRRWPCAAESPPPCDLVLLADPGLVAEPDFYALARRRAGGDLRQADGELFLKTAAASGSCA